jgi:hypothetical protein
MWMFDKQHKKKKLILQYWLEATAIVICQKIMIYLLWLVYLFGYRIKNKCFNPEITHEETTL